MATAEHQTHSDAARRLHRRSASIAIPLNILGMGAATAGAGCVSISTARRRVFWSANIAATTPGKEDAWIPAHRR
jgi:hypothetical protein